MSKKDIVGAIGKNIKKKPKPKPGNLNIKKGSGTSSAQPKKAVNALSKTKTFSLYPDDFAKIEKLESILRAKLGGKFSDSLLVRVALDTCSLNPKVLEKSVEKLQSEDGRRKE